MVSLLGKTIHGGAHSHLKHPHEGGSVHFELVVGFSWRREYLVVHKEGFFRCLITCVSLSHMKSSHWLCEDVCIGKTEEPASA